MLKKRCRKAVEKMKKEEQRKRRKNTKKKKNVKLNLEFKQIIQCFLIS